MINQKILLIDDHEVVRAGFRSLLASSEQCFEVIEANSAEAGYRAYLEHKPHVIISDINMPGMGGVELIKRIRARDVNVRIVVLSMYDDPGHVQIMKNYGVNAFVTKRSAPTELLKAIQPASGRGMYLSLDIKKYIKDGLTYSEGIELLSKREFEIFVLLAQGRSVKEIAEDITI
ncbi:MAG: response regulator transcription factor, partial [Gammaproteobacteria bacterium]|nr:response regulator transcription factor [Gammaproteobacteria bacterium]